MKRKLMIAHNLWLDNLMFSMSIGGLPCPSMAIFATDIGFSNFGDVSLIMDANKFRPSSKSPVFCRDIYSGRTPLAFFKINEEARDNLKALIFESVTHYGLNPDLVHTYVTDDDVIESGPVQMIQKSTDDLGLMLHYLKLNGHKVSLPMKERKTPFYWLSMDSLKGILSTTPLNKDTDRNEFSVFLYEEARKFVEACCSSDGGDEESKALYDEILSEINKEFFVIKNDQPVIAFIPFETLQSFCRNESSSINGSDLVVDTSALKANVKELISKNSVKFKNWARENLKNLALNPYFKKPAPGKSPKRIAFTIDNVAKHMKGNLRDTESATNSNSGTISSYVSESLPSMTAISKISHKIVTESTLDAFTEKCRKDLVELATKFEQYYRFEPNHYKYLNSFADEIGLYVKSGKNLKSIADTFKIDIIPSELIDELNAYITRLKEAPTTYFEVKFQRPVLFDEFIGAVVPFTTPKDVIQELTGLGLKVVGYDPAIPNDRAVAVEKFASSSIITHHDVSETTDLIEQSMTVK